MNVRYTVKKLAIFAGPPKRSDQPGVNNPNPKYKIIINASGAIMKRAILISSPIRQLDLAFLFFIQG